jgi:hypothetical protein
MGRPSSYRRYNGEVRPRGIGLRRALQLLVAAYFVALAAMPFAHHDLVCHLKSTTHCGTCHVGTSADAGGSDPAVAAIALAEAGRADHVIDAVAASPALLPSAGRSPPAVQL